MSEDLRALGTRWMELEAEKERLTAEQEECLGPVIERVNEVLSPRVVVELDPARTTIYAVTEEGAHARIYRRGFVPAGTDVLVTWDELIVPPTREQRLEDAVRSLIVTLTAVSNDPRLIERASTTIQAAREVLDER